MLQYGIIVAVVSSVYFIAIDDQPLCMQNQSGGVVFVVSYCKGPSTMLQYRIIMAVVTSVYFTS